MENGHHQTLFVISQEYAESLQDSFYDKYYSVVTDDAVRWREFGATEKCKSIIELCKGMKFDKVVDIGAGLCNVLSKLDELDFAPELYAFEISPSIMHFIKENINIQRLKAVYILDTSKTGFDDNFFDLGILSHVLEHVANPIELLSETLRICKYVLIEVPLEDCLFSNIHAQYIEKTSGRKRTDNSAGHINFFDKGTIQNLVVTSGGIILKQRIYRSWEVYQDDFGIVPFFQLFKSVMFHLVYRITKTRIVPTHCAMLITRGNDSTRSPEPSLSKIYSFGNRIDVC